MKFFFAILVLINFSLTLQAQKTTQTDIWSGEYAIYPTTDLSKSAGNLTIVKLKDLKTSVLPARLQTDPERWTIISQQEKKTDSTTVRRFLFDSENDEYKEFGWTDLHRSGKMNCIDGGHFFICKTNPKTTVDLKGDKPFFSETGFFGVWLHYGLVTIHKNK